MSDVQNIDASEWLAEWERVALGGQPNDSGYTREDLEAIWGCSDRIVLKRLKVLARAGRVIVGYRSTKRIDGRAAATPCYRLKPTA